jgi:transposase
MMGNSEPQKSFLQAVTLEELVPGDHPLRRIRPLIDVERIRELCKGYYSADNGRPSIPPEQLFLAWLGGYLLGCRSDRKLVMELQCNMAFRWFVGLDIGTKVWDHSTFARNRCERFEGTEIFDALFDDTVRQARTKGLISHYWSVDGTLVRANASHKSLSPIVVDQSPGHYRQELSGKTKAERLKSGKDDEGGPKNPTVKWEGEKRSNATHRSTTDPDSRLACKGREGAQPSYHVNGVMENRNRILVGIGVEVFRGSTSEREGALSLIERAKQRLRLKPKTVGGDKGYFEAGLMKTLDEQGIKPHIATLERAHQPIHEKVKKMTRTLAYQTSQRARKRIEELWGEAKEQHGFRRFARRGLERVRQEAMMIGWLLNLKRLASFQVAV